MSASPYSSYKSAVVALGEAGETAQLIELIEALKPPHAEWIARVFARPMPRRVPAFYVRATDGDEHGGDLETYCWDHAYVIAAAIEGDVDGETSISDSPRYCNVCGERLNLSLTDYGIDQEIDHALTYGVDDELLWDLCNALSWRIPEGSIRWGLAWLALLGADESQAAEVAA